MWRKCSSSGPRLAHRLGRGDVLVDGSAGVQCAVEGVERGKRDVERDMMAQWQWVRVGAAREEEKTRGRARKSCVDVDSSILAERMCIRCRCGIDRFPTSSYPR